MSRWRKRRTNEYSSRLQRRLSHHFKLRLRGEVLSVGRAQLLQAFRIDGFGIEQKTVQVEYAMGDTHEGQI